MTLYLTSSVFPVARSIYEKINRNNPALAFISTAAEVEEGDLGWLKDSMNSLSEAGFDVTEYTITGKNREQIKSDLSKFEVIFFSGGNQFYLLQKIQETQCAEVIRDLVITGKIYIGESAGSIVAGNNIYSTYYEKDVEKAPKLKGYEALNLVDFVVFPHWGTDYFRNKYLDFRMRHAYT